MSRQGTLRLIETFQVGPSHAGHTRTVYAGAGMEVWEEIRAPLHFGAYMLGMFPKNTLTVFLDSLPDEPPEGCTHCGPTPRIYGEGTIPQIEWHGRGALEKGWDWLRSQGVVHDGDDGKRQGLKAA